MFPKLLAVLVGTVVIAAALLAVRQQRLATMHEMAVLHRQVQQQRQALWASQVKIAQRSRPDELRAALARAGVTVEPLATPTPQLPAVASGPDTPGPR